MLLMIEKLLSIRFNPDESKYVGEFKNDKRHGKGIYTYVNGKVVKGIWKKDEFIKLIK